MTGGFVSIVGAGPGDPDLLTLAAIRRLRRADVVLFDALVEPGALRFARRAARVLVGKRAGRPAFAQEAINRRLIAAARQGLRVVRLKGGDAFVFGRGGEEALALAAAGVPFEIVPGISAATAAPALAAVPVTHRGVAPGFVVVTGHDASTFVPILESLAPNVLTLVVLMGVRTRATMAATLLHAGWRPDTPAAVVLGASTVGAARWAGTLDQLRDVVLDDLRDRPGTIVVGDVVRLAGLIDPGMDGTSRIAAHAAREQPTCAR